MRYAVVFACAVALGAGCRRAGHDVGTSKSSATPIAETTPFVIGENTKWKTVEEFDYAGNPALSPVHFKLELPEGYDDAGDFIRIRIWVEGQSEFIVDNRDGWVDYNNHDEPSGVYQHLQNQNLVQSRHVLVLRATHRASEPPLVLLRSWGYASSAERLHVIGFQKTGKPVLLFNDELDLTELSDLDGDGYPEIVGVPTTTEGLGKDFETYVPFEVYKIPRSMNGPAQLSIALSKRYNLKHNYGWVEPDRINDVLVALHPPGGGKPVIVSKAEAEKIMSQSRK